jgi:hypothetical protein
MTTLWDYVHEVGIRPYRDGHLREEYLSIPLRYRRLSGLPLDEALDEAIARGLMPANATESDLIESLCAGKPRLEEPRLRVHDRQPRCQLCGRWMTVYDLIRFPERGYLEHCESCLTAIQPRCEVTGRWLTWRRDKELERAA